MGKDHPIISDLLGGLCYNYINSKCHLGNLRVSFRDSSAAPVGGVYKPPVLVQANGYDAFGLEVNSFNGVNTNSWKYQNQERIDEFGLGVDFFKFRPSDYQIGRF